MEHNLVHFHSPTGIKVFVSSSGNNQCKLNFYQWWGVVLFIWYSSPLFLSQGLLTKQKADKTGWGWGVLAGLWKALVC